MKIHRLSFDSLVKLQNDAIVYYNIIIRNILTLYIRYHDVLDNVYLLQTTTFRQIKYQIQTANGISQKDEVCQDCFMISSNKNITWEKYILGYIYYKGNTPTNG